MRIVQNTPNTLHIEHNPWIMRWGIWLAAGACTWWSLTSPADSLAVAERLLTLFLGLGGLLVGWYFMPKNGAGLDRALQTVTLTEKRFTGTSSVTHPLSELDDVIATEGGGEYAGMQSLLFVIRGVRTPLEKGYVAADRKAVRDETKHWLQQARA